MQVPPPVSSSRHTRRGRSPLWRVLSWPLWTPIALAAIILSLRGLPNNPRDGFSAARVWLDSSFGPRSGRQEPYIYAVHHLLIFDRGAEAGPEARFDLWGAYSMGPALSDRPRPGGAAAGYLYLVAYRERRGLWAITRQAEGVRDAGMGWFQGNRAMTEAESRAILALAEAYHQNLTDGTRAPYAGFIARHLARNRTGQGPEVRRFPAGYTHTAGIALAFILLGCSLPNFITWLPRRIHERRRSAIGKCRHCGYDVRGLPGSTCPECGRGHGVNAG